MPNWTETKPQQNDFLSELPSVVTANAIAFRQAIEKHAFWTEASGASAGIPRLSDGSFGPGAARAFFDVQSSVSTALATSKALAGRLYVTSDTSRLFAYASSTTAIAIGTKNAVVFLGASLATLPSNTRVLVQGASTLMSGSTSTTPFAVAYSVAPTIQLHSLSASTLNFGVPLLLGSTTTNFACRVAAVYGGPSFSVLWRSIGTVTL